MPRHDPEQSRGPIFSSRSFAADRERATTLIVQASVTDPRRDHAIARSAWADETVRYLWPSPVTANLTTLLTADDARFLEWETVFDHCAIVNAAGEPFDEETDVPKWAQDCGLRLAAGIVRFKYRRVVLIGFRAARMFPGPIAGGPPMTWCAVKYGDHTFQLAWMPKSVHTNDQLGRRAKWFWPELIEAASADQEDAHALGNQGQ